jgi:hypothetical protein
MARKPRTKVADGSGAVDDAAPIAPLIVPDGFVALRHDGGCVAAHAGGTIIEANDDGIFIVPTADAAGLIEAHGFTVAELED